VISASTMLEVAEIPVSKGTTGRRLSEMPTIRELSHSGSNQCCEYGHSLEARHTAQVEVGQNKADSVDTTMDYRSALTCGQTELSIAPKLEKS